MFWLFILLAFLLGWVTIASAPPNRYAGDGRPELTRRQKRRMDRLLDAYAPLPHRPPPPRAPLQKRVSVMLCAILRASHLFLLFPGLPLLLFWLNF